MGELRSVELFSSTTILPILKKFKSPCISFWTTKALLVVALCLFVRVDAEQWQCGVDAEHVSNWFKTEKCEECGTDFCRLCRNNEYFLDTICKDCEKSIPVPEPPVPPPVPDPPIPDPTNQCPDCGGLGIPPGTLKRYKTICDKCTGLGVWRLEHLPHEKCIKVLENQRENLIAKQREYLGLGKDEDVGDSPAPGSIRRVNTEIRREEERKTQLENHFGADGDKRREATITGRLESTKVLKDLKGTVIRCSNAQNQQYEVKIAVTTDADAEKLAHFYKAESKRHKKDDTHYVYVQRQELTAVRRRLASGSRHHLPETYDAPCPSERALVRRRLMSRPESHIVILERLLEEIKE